MLRYAHARLVRMVLSLLVTVVLTACEDSVTESSDRDVNDSSGEWLIPRRQVFDGGPGIDGIPSIDNPQFVSIDQANYLKENDLIIGVRVGDDIRGYPHPILDWHEIINDEMAGNQFSVTYCPLTGSAVGWDRELDVASTTFGVSGLLYNTNLMPYDRATGTYWSQMLLQAVHGDLIGARAGIVPIIETSWKTWQAAFPNSQVVSTNTGFSRTYGRYPYGDYRTNHDRLLFPVTNSDDRLPRKERVLGILGEQGSRVYPIAEFGQDITIVIDSFESQPIVVVGSAELNIAVAYVGKASDGTELTFSPVNDELPVVMQDSEGTKYDLFGVAVDGPGAGSRLEQARSFIAMWFAWAAFYPEAEIHGM